jgi:hypothetical protein
MHGVEREVDYEGTFLGWGHSYRTAETCALVESDDGCVMVVDDVQRLQFVTPATQEPDLSDIVDARMRDLTYELVSQVQHGFSKIQRG